MTQAEKQEKLAKRIYSPFQQKVLQNKQSIVNQRMSEGVDLNAQLSYPVQRPKVERGVPNNDDDYHELFAGVLRDQSPLAEV